MERFIEFVIRWFGSGFSPEPLVLKFVHTCRYNDKDLRAYSVRNRPVRPGLVRTGTDGKNPSVREQDGDGAVFLRLDGDGRKGRPSTEKS